MKIAFDLDDTLCMTDEYSEYYITKFIEENNLPIKKIREIARYSDGKYDWDFEYAKKWFKTYGDEMMLQFPSKQYAVEVIKELRKRGHKIAIITARADDWHREPEQTSIKWLEKNDIEYDELFFGRADKEAICKDIDVDIFVDDDLDITENVAKMFSGSNKKVFLMNSAWNENFPEPEGVIRIHNLKELLENLD